MTYDEALSYIHSCKLFGSKKNGLQNMELLMQRLGEPHKRYPVIHVAGTNGKGSTCSMIANVLKEAGLKTALYTSPYLERFNERMRVDGTPISDDELATAAAEVISVVKALVTEGMDHPTEFELGTAIAFHFFAKCRVDVAVIEVGIGGRLDSTNVVTPEVSVICAVDMDHTNLLGDSIEEIASEKAGIIKPGIPTVLYPQGGNIRAVVAKRAAELDSELIDLGEAEITVFESGLQGHSFSLKTREYIVDGLYVNLLGKHQIYNASTAVAALMALARRRTEWNIQENIKKGLLCAQWPGRLEIVSRSPLVLLDGAHNPHAAKALANAIKELFYDKKVILVTGILGGKDAEAIASELALVSHCVIATAPNAPRARSAESVGELFKGCGADVRVISDANSALDAAMALCGSDSVIIAAGSLYLAGELRKRFHG